MSAKEFRALAFFAAILLFLILPASKHQYLKVLPFVIFIVLILKNC